MIKINLPYIPRERHAAARDYIRKCVGPANITFHYSVRGEVSVIAAREADSLFAYIAWG